MLKEVTQVYVTNYRYLLGRKKNESGFVIRFELICVLLIIRNNKIRRVLLQRKVDKRRK